MSEVWKYFKKINANEAKCLLENCTSVIKVVNFGTSSLKNHLDKKHKSISKNDYSSDLTSSSSSTGSSLKSQKTNKISQFIVRESRQLLLAKCAAKDGFPINKITSSDACKAYLTSRQYQMPLTPSTVWNDIKKYHQEVFKIFKEAIIQSKNAGKKFSIIIDE